MSFFLIVVKYTNMQFTTVAVLTCRICLTCIHIVMQNLLSLPIKLLPAPLPSCGNHHPVCLWESSCCRSLTYGNLHGIGP